MTDARTPGLLDGVRVLDLATERAELAGRMLADLGAEMIKIEPPDGAPARRRPPFDETTHAGGDRSLYWAAVALGKQSVVLDLEDHVGAERLRGLVASADVLIESFDPGVLEARGLGFAALSAINPGLVYVSVTPYGQSGPHALRPATELTLEAAGGLLGLQGDGDRPPVPVGLPQAAFHAGIQAAADAVIALNERDQSGLGQHLDVSMQAAVVWTLMQASGFPPNTGGDPPNTGAERAWPTPERLAGGAVPHIVECADGYASAQLTIARPGTWAAALRWRDAEVGIDDELRAVDWLTWDAALADGQISAELVARAHEEVLALFRSKTKQQLMDWAVEHRLLVAPILSTADLLRDPHLQARDFWREIAGRTHPGPVA
ncbi:MAG: CoA transferase, partial [Chloroflexi bacterium]|nr:CoA transferase [Chloroflexota bacterium]